MSKSRHLLFFSLALIVVLIGYSFLLEEGITGASQKAYSQPTGKAYTPPANMSAADNESSAPNQTNESAGPPAENQAIPPPSEPVNEPENQVISPPSELVNEPDSRHYTINETTAPVSRLQYSSPTAVSTAIPTIKVNGSMTALSGTSKILLTISNPTADPVLFKPKIEELTAPLPDEARVYKMVVEELEQEQNINIPAAAQQKMEILRIIEQEKVKPLHIRKVYHPFESITAALTYTGKRTGGQLLLFPALSPIMVLPGEQKQVTITFPQVLSAAGRETHYSIIANGVTYYNTTLSIPPSLSTAIDVNPAAQTMDFYLSIPQQNPGEYFLEVKIGKVYYELFGPYILGNESALFSQQFAYSFEGSQPVALSIIKDGEIMQEVKEEVQFGEGNI